MRHSPNTPVQQLPVGSRSLIGFFRPNAGRHLPRKSSGDSTSPQFQHSGNIRSVSTNRGHNVFANLRAVEGQGQTAGKAKPSQLESTLTKGESAIFERIKMSLERGQPSGKELNPATASTQYNPGYVSTVEVLNEVFSEALDPSRDDKVPILVNNRPRGEQPWRHKSMILSPAILKHLGNAVKPDQRPIDKLPDNSLVRDTVRQLVRAQFDTEILSTLESKVFSRMKAMTAQLTAQTDAMTSPTARRPRGPFGKPTRALTSVARLGLNHGSTFPASSSSMSAGAPLPEAAAVEAATAAATGTSPTSTHGNAELLPLLQESYAPILVCAARELRTRFPRSPFLPTLLRQVKALGPISYVIGASTTLYNELLLVRWTGYRDLHGCAELLRDMLDGAVSADMTTFAIFADAHATRRREMGVSEDTASNGKLNSHKAYKAAESSIHAENKGVIIGRERAEAAIVHTANEDQVSPVLSGWWRLQGTQSGWEQWEAVYNELVVRFEEDSERKAEEEKLTRADTRQSVARDEADEPSVVVYDYTSDTGALDDVLDDHQHDSETFRA